MRSAPRPRRAAIRPGDRPVRRAAARAARAGGRAGPGTGARGHRRAHRRRRRRAGRSDRGPHRRARARSLASGVPARVACFTSLTPGADLARIAGEQDVDLLLVDAPDGLLEDAQILALLAGAPCDVGVVGGGAPRPGAVLVPFAGAEHDWARSSSAPGSRATAGSPCGSSARAPARRGGTRAACWRARRSRCSGRSASPADPVLVDADARRAWSTRPAMPASSWSASPIAGAARAWGRARTALATRSGAPAILVRRGRRPGGLAPREADTRFTWTIVA